MTPAERSLAVCVFCSSSDRAPEPFKDAARALGEAIGRRGHRLIFGGTAVGLMRICADAVRESGGTVCGIIPRFMVEKGIGYEEADEMVVVEDMRTRKAEMERRADAFLALPGGIGTLEETLEILTLAQLRIHSKPIGLLNVDGFYTPLLDFLRGMIEQNLAKPSLATTWLEESNPVRMLDLLETHRPTDPGSKWFG